MTAELWYGRKPRAAHVQQALVDLYRYLSSQAEHFVLLINFRLITKHNVDLVVLKHDGIFLAEMCRAWDPIIGGCEGDWKAVKPDGAQVVLNAGRLNPFKQIQTHYCNWRDWLAAHRRDIQVDHTCALDCADVFSYIVLYPDVPADSQITIGSQPVQPAGLNEFLIALALRSSAQTQLSREALGRIPRLLGLEAWALTAPSSGSHQTQKLDFAWQPSRASALLSLGHDLSAPIVELNGRSRLRVGRGEDNDVVIHHPAVSRHHAEIVRVGDYWVVRDLGSNNGTFVNPGDASTSERIVGQSPGVLAHRSIIRFGPAAYVFYFDGA